MKISTQTKLKNFIGETLKDNNEDVTIGKAIANILISSEEKGKMKLFVLAQKFYNDENVELDNSDFELVKKTVGETKIYNALVAGQVELFLSELKNETAK